MPTVLAYDALLDFPTNRLRVYITALESVTPVKRRNR